MPDGMKIIFDCPLPPWAVAACAAAVAVAAMVFARRDAAQASRRVRRSLLALLGLAALMLAGLLLGPTFIRRWDDPHKPQCAVLVDNSRSMLLADAYEGQDQAWLRQRLPQAAASQPAEATREQVLQALLADRPDGWLAGLRRQFDLAGWQFASTCTPLGLAGPSPAFGADPEGYATAIGPALAEAARPRGGLRPAAIVLLSDGAWNTGSDPAEVAATLGRLGTPVFVVGLGNPQPPRDAAVVALRAPKTVLLGDELLLTAQVAASGMGAIRLPVQLLAGGKVLEEKQVVAQPSGRPVNVTFSFLPIAPGAESYTVRIPKQAGEADEANNIASAAVEVVERKIHVLLADSEPRWEMRFLRNVLERDPAVALTVCLLRPGIGGIAGPGYLKALPRDRKDLAGFDLVILGDIARQNLPDDFLAELAEMVRQKGAALIVMAGRAGNYRRLAGTPLEGLLPVTLEGAPDSPVASARAFRPELTQEGQTHLVTRLAGGEGPGDNDAAWRHLPEVYWSAGVAGLARGATALLVHPHRLAGTSKLPLLSVARAGSGKTMFCGLDETWRWRKTVGDVYHYRFWAQAIRWLVKKQFTGGDPRGRLSIDRNECDVGEAVEVEAFCLATDGFPLQGAKVRLLVRGPGQDSQVLAMDPAGGGWGVYRATFVPQQPGNFQMQPIVSTYGEQPLASSVGLAVSRADLERKFLAQDRTSLEAVAQASGGLYLPAGRIDELPALLAGQVQKRSMTAEYSPCRHWAYYTALAAVLGAAWFLRKRSGLARRSG